MKNLFTFPLIGLVSAALIFSGCTTFKPPVSGDPDEVLAYQEKIERTALLLENATYSAILIVVEKNEEEKDLILGYTSLAITAVQTILFNNQLTPQDLDNALKVIPVKEFKTLEAKLIVPTIVSLYTIWFGDHTAKWFGVDKNYVGRTLLSAVLRGAEKAKLALE
jgi:hypothetical protein